MHSQEITAYPGPTQAKYLVPSVLPQLLFLPTTLACCLKFRFSLLLLIFSSIQLLCFLSVKMFLESIYVESS